MPPASYHLSDTDSYLPMCWGEKRWGKKDCYKLVEWKKQGMKKQQKGHSSPYPPRPIHVLSAFFFWFFFCYYPALEKLLLCPPSHCDAAVSSVLCCPVLLTLFVKICVCLCVPFLLFLSRNNMPTTTFTVKETAGVCKWRKGVDISYHRGAVFQVDYRVRWHGDSAKAIFECTTSAFSVFIRSTSFFSCFRTHSSLLCCALGPHC